MRRFKIVVLAALLAATLTTACRDSMGPSDSPRPSFDEAQGANN